MKLKYLPHSLFGRLVLVMTLGLFLAQLISIGFHLLERQRTVGHNVSDDITQRIAAIYRAVNYETGDKQDELVKRLSSPNFKLNIQNMDSSNKEHCIEDAHFLSMLQHALGQNVLIQAYSVPKLGIIEINLCLALDNHQCLHIQSKGPRRVFGWPHHLVMNLAVMFIALVGLSLFIVRAITRPLDDLARAARGLGEDLNRPPLPETGPQEIATAAKEFNAMQIRLRDSIQERAQFLAAVSHDLKTPITRLRLRTEMLEDESLQKKFVHDLNEMETMVITALSFLRGEIVDEVPRLVDVTALIESIVDDFIEAGADIKIEISESVRLNIKPQALRRCLSNLIDNALKYGIHGVSVAVQVNSNDVDIFIRDEGSGLDAGLLNKVFEPFYRVENSRSRETGGTGLGLAIAKQIARAHQGDLTLRNRKSGGLEAQLHLPKK